MKESSELRPKNRTEANCNLSKTFSVRSLHKGFQSLKSIEIPQQRLKALRLKKNVRHVVSARDGFLVLGQRMYDDVGASVYHSRYRNIMQQTLCGAVTSAFLL